ncbi:MAG: hypothetical protein MUC49_04780 [Raineya sp.]|jgi:hypothetical protein|nr:hypothetical protein [Raineya sp.]
MRFLWILMLLFGLCSANMPNKAPIISDTTHSFSKKNVSYTELKTALETQKGKKLNFTEKLVTKILVKKLNKSTSSQKREKRPIHSANIMSFLFGLLAYLLIYTNLVLVLILAIFALVLGIKGIRKSGKKKKFSGKGFAIAGIVLAFAPLLISLFVIGCSILDLVLGVSICGP